MIELFHSAIKNMEGFGFSSIGNIEKIMPAVKNIMMDLGRDDIVCDYLTNSIGMVSPASIYFNQLLPIFDEEDPVGRIFIKHHADELVDYFIENFDKTNGHSGVADLFKDLAQCGAHEEFKKLIMKCPPFFISHALSYICDYKVDFKKSDYDALVDICEKEGVDRVYPENWVFALWIAVSKENLSFELEEFGDENDWNYLLSRISSYKDFTPTSYAVDTISKLYDERSPKGYSPSFDGIDVILSKSKKYKAYAIGSDYEI